LRKHSELRHNEPSLKSSLQSPRELYTVSWNIHPIFHNNLLTPYIETNAHGPNFTRPPPDLINGEAEYEVEAIKSHRYFGKNKKLQYLLKWKGYLEADNT
jgi:Chromo (CHRromatin Organisation MOdifier) domain